MRGQRELHVLEAGSALMFGTLTVLATTIKSDWTVWEVRLWVDCGLVVVVVASIALGRPFTMQHARHAVGADAAKTAAFVHVCKVIAGAWALAFAALAAIDFYMLKNPDAPTRRGVLLTIAALVAAAKFTQSYAGKARERARGVEKG